MKETPRTFAPRTTSTEDRVITSITAGADASEVPIAIDQDPPLPSVDRVPHQPSEASDNGVGAGERGQQEAGAEVIPDPAEVRRKAEEAILAKRRKAAEAAARLEAASRQAARDLEKQKETDSIRRLKKAFTISVRPRCDRDRINGP